MRMRKKVALLLAVLLLAGLFSACKGESGQAVLTVDGKTVPMPYAFTVDGESITLDEFRYYFHFAAMFEEDGDFSAEDNARLRAEASERILMNHAMTALAHQLGLSVTKEDEAAIAANIQASIDEQGGRPGYLALLAEYDMTEAVFEKLLWENTLHGKLNETLFGETGTYAFTDEQVLEKINPADYAAVRYIFRVKDEEGTENQSAMEEAAEKLRAGADFEAVLRSYCQDNLMTGSDAPHIFEKGTEAPSFEEAVMKLAEGEISGQPVETEEGLFLFHRLVADKALVRNNMELFLPIAQEQVFSILLEDIVAAFSVEYHQSYGLIAMDTLS